MIRSVSSGGMFLGCIGVSGSKYMKICTYTNRSVSSKSYPGKPARCKVFRHRYPCMYVTYLTQTQEMFQDKTRGIINILLLNL